MPSLVHFYNFFEQQFYLLTVYRYFCLVFRISKLFHNYIKFNFHVGLAVLSLVQITKLDFDLPFHFSHQFIFFLAPFLAYNFIKFHRFLWKEIDSIIKWLLFLIGFIKNERSEKIKLICFLAPIMIVLYFLPPLSQARYYPILILLYYYILLLV